MWCNAHWEMLFAAAGVVVGLALGWAFWGGRDDSDPPDEWPVLPPPSPAPTRPWRVK